MRTLTAIISILMLSRCCNANADTVTTKQEAHGLPVEVHVSTGEHWKHTLMRILHLYPIKTTPQIAVWIEDTHGNFLETLFVTEKYATQSWRKTPGENISADKVRRIEALSCWSHRHGNMYEDGLPAPTRTTPLSDAITGASPSGNFTLHSTLETKTDSVMVYVEINNSTDFNEFYTKDAHHGEPGYSGGKFGSGQPALVYGAIIATGNTDEAVPLTLLGHSSPDGSDGAIISDLSTITTAVQIVDEITVVLK